MVVQSRRDRLLEMIRTRGFAALPDLAGELSVSESTVRRDLEYLEALGHKDANRVRAFVQAAQQAFSET